MGSYLRRGTTASPVGLDEAPSMQGEDGKEAVVTTGGLSS